MNVSLSVNNQNSYQASAINSFSELRFPGAQEETAVSLNTNFGSQTARVRENYLQLTEGFDKLSFSARDFVRSLAA